MIAETEKTSDFISDEIAEQYGYDVSSTLSARLKLELALQCVKPSCSVLDVGCANGLFMLALVSRCKEITGIDINDRMLELAQSALSYSGLENFHLCKQSASALDFPDQTFDVAYSFSTLLLVPDTIKALHQIARVLKHGGRAVLDITGRYNISRLHWGRYYRRKGHFGLNSFAYSTIKYHLENMGFLIEQHHALGFTDQWRYIRGLNRLTFLDRLFHAPGERDLDYLLSNQPCFFPFANRWYLVCRKL